MASPMIEYCRRFISADGEPYRGPGSLIMRLPEEVNSPNCSLPPADARGNISGMSYFVAATHGLSIAASRRRQVERLFRDANAAWVELTDYGYELSILGELHSISYTLEEAIEELNMALLLRRGGLLHVVEVMDLGDGVWGVDMAD